MRELSQCALSLAPGSPSPRVVDHVDLQQRFFAANPAGSEADFKRLLPKLRDAEQTRRTEASRDSGYRI